MKEWVRDHKKILKEAASALLAFVVGAAWYLWFIRLNPTKDRFVEPVSLHEDSQQFVALPSKALTLEDLFVIELARRRKDTKIGWLCLHSQVWKSSEFLHKKIRVFDGVQLWVLWRGSSLYHRIPAKQVMPLCKLDSRICAQVGRHYQSKKNLKLADFADHKPWWKKEKGTSVEENWTNQAFPILFDLYKGQASLSCLYQATDGLVSLTLWNVTRVVSTFDEEGVSKWSEWMKRIEKLICYRFCVLF